MILDLGFGRDSVTYCLRSYSRPLHMTTMTTLIGLLSQWKTTIVSDRA